MISGIDYVIYASKHPKDVEHKFKNLIIKFWTNSIHEEWERNNTRLELFFYENEEMYKLFDTKGYSVNKHGEGPFLIIANKLENFNSTVEIKTIRKPENRFNTEVYLSELVLKDIWEYTLIFSDETTNNIFFENIYNDILKILTE